MRAETQEPKEGTTSITQELPDSSIPTGKLCPTCWLWLPGQHPTCPWLEAGGLEGPPRGHWGLPCPVSGTWSDEKQ